MIRPVGHPWRASRRHAGLGPSLAAKAPVLSLVSEADPESTTGPNHRPQRQSRYFTPHTPDREQGVQMILVLTWG
ncbi:MAG: hypothetical protein KJ621_03105 [Proteobacteria bacterium]|nr:hypothetical protein [Pseudomonadota bacterium]MBU1740752.1 hypothetical protein [Pseudomonadota bacterium]